MVVVPRKEYFSCFFLFLSSVIVLGKIKLFFLDLLKEQPFHHFLVSLSILELE